GRARRFARGRRGGRGLAGSGRGRVGRNGGLDSLGGGACGLLRFVGAATACGEGEESRCKRDGGGGDLHRKASLLQIGLIFRGPPIAGLPARKGLGFRALWPPRLTGAELLPPGIPLLSPATIHAYRPAVVFSESASTWRGELAATLRLAGPLAAANLLQMLVYAIDVIFVARLGEEALAASSLSIALFGLMMWCFSGLTGMVAALIAAELGRRRHAVREVRRSARMALWLGLACGLAGMAVCRNGREIMLLTGQEPHISELAGGFLRVIMWAMVPMGLANVLRSVVSALGRPIFATAISALAIG